MSSGNFFSPAGLSAAATILLTLPGQVQARALLQIVGGDKLIIPFC